MKEFVSILFKHILKSFYNSYPRPKASTLTWFTNAGFNTVFHHAHDRIPSTVVSLTLIG